MPGDALLPSLEYEGVHCTLVIRRPAPAVAVVVLSGSDIGEFADFLSEIKAHQPSGPYRLCGYSFGGLVAFEIARRLSEAGENVEFVGLFDTTMSPLRWPLRAWLSIIGRRIARLAGNLPNPPLRGVLSSLPASMIRVAASALFASARYHPGFYRGQLTLFTPVGREPGLPPLEAVWRKHARALSVVETEGDHSTMLSAPNADSTAASLTRCLSALSTCSCLVHGCRR